MFIICPVRENVDSEHVHSKPCHWKPVPFSRGDARNNKFSSGHEVFSGWNWLFLLLFLNGVALHILWDIFRNTSLP